MDVSVVLKPIFDFIFYFMTIELTFAGITFTTGSVFICLMVAGIIGIFLRG